MIIEKEVRLGGTWGKIGKTHDENDILVILDAGNVVPNKFYNPDKKGSEKEQYVFKMRNAKGEEFNLGFNRRSRNYLAEAYGENTDNWVGKNVKVWIMEAPTGLYAILTAPDWKKVRKQGQKGPFIDFVAPSTEVMIEDEENGSEDTDEVPF